MLRPCGLSLSSLGMKRATLFMLFSRGALSPLKKVLFKMMMRGNLRIYDKAPLGMLISRGVVSISKEKDMFKSNDSQRRCCELTRDNFQSHLSPKQS